MAKNSPMLVISRGRAPYHISARAASKHHLGSYLIVPHTYNTSQTHIYNKSQIENFGHLNFQKSEKLPPKFGEKIVKNDEIQQFSKFSIFFSI